MQKVYFHVDVWVKMYFQNIRCDIIINFNITNRIDLLKKKGINCIKNTNVFILKSTLPSTVFIDPNLIKAQVFVLVKINDYTSVKTHKLRDWMISAYSCFMLLFYCCD